LHQLEKKTQVIELCDHYEYYSDGRGEINNVSIDDDNDRDVVVNPLNIEILEEETLGGYASGPDELERSNILPIILMVQ
jgi:hypothetical protein